MSSGQAQRSSAPPSLPFPFRLRISPPQEHFRWVSRIFQAERFVEFSRRRPFSFSQTVKSLPRLGLFRLLIPARSVSRSPSRLQSLLRSLARRRATSVSSTVQPCLARQR